MIELGQQLQYTSVDVESLCDGHLKIMVFPLFIWYDVVVQQFHCNSFHSS